MESSSRRKVLTMFNGVVKYFNQDRGYGFIASENMEDTFFHFSDIEGSVKVAEMGDKVTFAIKDTMKDGVLKRKAIHVNLL